jgi:hypothetical protein
MRPTFDQDGAGFGRWHPDNRDIVADFPSVQAAKDRGGRDVAAVAVLLDLKAQSNNEEPLKPKATEAVKLTLETFPVATGAATDKVGDGLALDRERLFRARHAIIAGL